MQRKLKLNEQYAVEVSGAIKSLFDPDSENHRYDLDEINATEFFIGIIKATGMLYTELTEDDKSFLEFTYLANQLIVQDLLDKE